MKKPFAALVAVLLLVTACPKQSPPPATSIVSELVAGTMAIVVTTLAQ